MGIAVEGKEVPVNLDELEEIARHEVQHGVDLGDGPELAAWRARQRYALKVIDPDD